LIAYLLHELPEDQRAALEDRWAADVELHEQIRMAEAELLDAYARGELSAAERKKVEACLLASESQREKLAFARSLAGAFPSAKRLRVSWRALAAAAAIVLMTGVTAWLGYQNTNLRREVARLAGNVAVTPSTASVYSALLSADRVRGSRSGRRIAIPAGAEAVRLELELEPGDEMRIDSASVSAAGRVVWSQRPVRIERVGSGYVAQVWIPAAVLGAGSYELQLSVGSAVVEYYTFAIGPAPR
jgi:hypothetical protein